jgi:hypothetical protein
VSAVTYTMGWKTGKPGFYLQKGRSFQAASEALLDFLFRLVPKIRKTGAVLLRGYLDQLDQLDPVTTL